jgi:hypothetical protein
MKYCTLFSFLLADWLFHQRPRLHSILLLGKMKWNYSCGKFPRWKISTVAINFIAHGTRKGKSSGALGALHQTKKYLKNFSNQVQTSWFYLDKILKGLIIPRKTCLIWHSASPCAQAASIVGCMCSILARLQSASCSVSEVTWILCSIRWHP